MSATFMILFWSYLETLPMQTVIYTLALLATIQMLKNKVLSKICQNRKMVNIKGINYKAFTK